MPKVKAIEAKILSKEGFNTVIRDKDGKDIRGDMVLPKQYQAERMTRNSHSVNQWRDKFKEQFPGYEIEVLDGKGNKVRGNTKLSTVRDTYLPE